MGTRTKFILAYVGGIVTGIVLTFVFFSFMVSYQGNSSSLGSDAAMYEKPQQEIKVTSFEVMQVLPDGGALAMVEDDGNSGMIVLFLDADKGASYYDEQKTDVPSGKRVMQVGTHRCVTRGKKEKTVPVVEIADK